jgi:hypothetical protein
VRDGGTGNERTGSLLEELGLDSQALVELRIFVEDVARADLPRIAERPGRAWSEVVDDFRLLHAATGNPLYALIAFQESRDRGAPVPEWVLSWIDGWAAKLVPLGWDPPRDPRPVIARALGFDRRPSPWKEALGRLRKLDRVGAARRAAERGELDPLESAALEKRVSRRTIEAAMAYSREDPVVMERFKEQVTAWLLVPLQGELERRFPALAAWPAAQVSELALEVAARLISVNLPESV